MKISVFITSYNQKAYLIEAVESVLSQTLRPFEIIIVDDCSQDGSQEVISGYASRYPDLIVPIYHLDNLGVAQTRIDALQAVAGDHVSYVDGDDRYLPTKLEKEAQTLQENPDAQIAFSNNYYMTADGTHVGVWVDEEMPPEGDVFRETFARDFPKRSLFRMELVQYQAWKRAGFHDPNLRLYEDWDMRIRLTRHHRVAYCDEALSEIRLHRTGLSRAPAAEHRAAREYIVQKNRALMDELSIKERAYIERKLDEWEARLIRREARESLSGRRYTDRMRAIGLYLRSLKYEPLQVDYRLLLDILLPHRVYESLRSLSHRIRGDERPLAELGPGHE